MKYIMEPLASGVYAIAVEDIQTWDMASYANVYLIQRDPYTIMIDAGMSDYREVLCKAMERIHLLPEQVTHLLLTHGHGDHVLGANAFPKAQKFVHPQDLSMLPRSLAGQFQPLTANENGEVRVHGLEDIEVQHVNTHTPGSVVYYDKRSEVMFAGDFFCFFGEALPEGKLVSRSETVRQESYKYVAEQAAADGVDIARFRNGVQKLLQYHPRYFCTGHGVVLEHDIHSFLNNLWNNGKE